MQLRTLINDDDAVSPVIGVILMVAITVILAAVIASFVLGLGDNATQSAPQASFSFDYDNSTDTVTIEHDGGDTIEAGELYVRGEGFATDETYIDDNAGDLNSTGSFADAGTYGETSEVSAGDRLKVGVSSQYDLTVVWQPEEGDTSAQIAQDTGPNA